jgi:hypothetical protein
MTVGEYAKIGKVGKAPLRVIVATHLALYWTGYACNNISSISKQRVT